MKDPVTPKLIENSRRVVPRHEAERLKETANKVFVRKKKTHTHH